MVHSPPERDWHGQPVSRPVTKDITSETRALATFNALPLAERWFVRMRLRSAPLDSLVTRLPDQGTIVDVGCGHGVLTALIATGSARRSVIGIDPDQRKIAWARRGPGVLPNVSFRAGTVEDLAPDLDGSVDAIVIVDVLYLLPAADWPLVLRACHRLLRPRGRLLLKEAEANGSWKHLKCHLQERLMVRILRRTRSSGGLTFRPRAWLEGELRNAGFRVLESLDLSRGYTTPHVLLVAEPAPRVRAS
jgi:2-polyprenyl-3-methyl-5-hydroxy-6-metoxy-1,4-benzoquinol methylase